MFTDIVGYTALMGRDEARALELVQQSLVIQRPLVQKHHGSWIKELGDGAIAQFDAASDAVKCAVEIQNVAKQALNGRLRIGIHLGDITMKGGDVFGDGVNVASRLQSIADPGGVYISDSVERAVKGQGSVEAFDLGEQRLKNVDYGVHVFALKGHNLPIPKWSRRNRLVRERPVIWISMYAIIAVALLGSVFYLVRPNTQQPLVLLMDGAHESKVYDREIYEAGATNADALSDILLDLPIRSQRETISPGWHRHEEMLEFEPDLIVVHYSGFRQEDSSGPRQWLKLLVEFFVTEGTKFLIYSRQHDELLRSQVDALLADLYQTHPNLKGRITVFGLLDYGEPRWMDPVVSSMFKLKIKEILSLQ